MKRYLTTLAALFICGGVYANTIEVPINLYSEDGSAKAIGKIEISETQYGLLFSPELSQLSPGIHGFHLHENPSCAAQEKEGKLVIAAAAGGHFDPDQHKQHKGPYDDTGHLGDLPALYVDADGLATYPVLAPRIKSLQQIKQRSVMIHVGGDNYADHPKTLGGGGARIACGVIE